MNGITAENLKYWLTENDWEFVTDIEYPPLSVWCKSFPDRGNVEIKVPNAEPVGLMDNWGLSKLAEIYGPEIYEDIPRRFNLNNVLNLEGRVIPFDDYEDFTVFRWGYGNPILIRDWVDQEAKRIKNTCLSIDPVALAVEGVPWTASIASLIRGEDERLRGDKTISLLRRDEKYLSWVDRYEDQVTRMQEIFDEPGPFRVLRWSSYFVDMRPLHDEVRRASGSGYHIESRDSLMPLHTAHERPGFRVDRKVLLVDPRKESDAIFVTLVDHKYGGSTRARLDLDVDEELVFGKGFELVHVKGNVHPTANGKNILVIEDIWAPFNRHVY